MNRNPFLLMKQRSPLNNLIMNLAKINHKKRSLSKKPNYKRRSLSKKLNHKRNSL